MATLRAGFLVIIATQTVHSTGINWLGISPIIAAIIAAAGVIIAWSERKDRRQEKRNNDIKSEITTSVDHLSEMLLAKLETKEKVAQISERLARLEGAAGSDRTSEYGRT